MHQVRPAMMLPGAARGPRAALWTLTFLAALWAVGSLCAVVIAVEGGLTGSFEYHGVTLPLWVLAALSLVASCYVTWDTAFVARFTGRNHGLIDYKNEPAGLTLMRMRRWQRRSELLVQRGETVVIDAKLVANLRGGRERHYRFTVAAPGGSFAFTQPIYVERLSLVPLDEVAGQLGVVVETTGEATLIERAGLRSGFVG